MNLRRYLKQTAIVEKALTDENDEPILDAYGKPQYASPNATSVRREERVEEVVSAGWTRERGNRLVSTIQYYTIEHIVAGDKIDDRLVMVTEDWTDNFGREVGRRCFT